jgi:hypothetical protein
MPLHTVQNDAGLAACYIAASAHKDSRQSAVTITRVSQADVKCNSTTLYGAVVAAATVRHGIQLLAQPVVNVGGAYDHQRRVTPPPPLGTAWYCCLQQIAIPSRLAITTPHLQHRSKSERTQQAHTMLPALTLAFEK